MNYYVTVNNLSGGGQVACDTSNITVRLQLPSPDGSPYGAPQIAVPTNNYPAETGDRRFGPFPYVVNANPGVTRLVARASVENGVLHDGPIHSDVNINRTIGSDRPIPDILVDKTADIRSGQAPQTTTYTFRVYNRTTPAYPLENVVVTDNQCPGVTRATPFGDVNGDNKLDPDEVWRYTCTLTHGAGTFTNVATACGELFIDSGALPKVCDEDDETVTFTPPPAVPPAVPPVNNPPQAAVLPATAVQAPCTIAAPSGITVRAGQLNTIRMRVRNVDAGTTVRLTLPGGKVVSAKTNSSGVATFRVRPTKSGTAKIRAVGCSEVERLSVKPARRVVARRAPRVTG